MSVFDEPLYTVQELAGHLGVSATTVYNRLHQWPHRRTHAKGIIRFTEQDVRDVLESMKVTPAPPSVRPNVGTRANRRAR